jgi:flagella basal body P-ring formation protein FlgA
LAAAFLQSACEAIGKWPRVPIRAGAALRADMLRNPQEVERGDTVRVEVRNGAARLELEAQAEGSGAVGETIPVRNPSSHQRFLVRVEGKGRVSMSISAGKVNP